LSRTRKRSVKATVQKVRTPGGLGVFINKLESENQVSVKSEIIKGSDRFEEYFYSLKDRFELENFEASANDIKECYWTHASIEFPRNKRTDENGEVLPRDYRVNTNDVPILLVKDSNDESFLIIISSYGPDIGRIDKLIGESNVFGIGEDECISNDFFVWMYYSYNNKEMILEDLNLNNIIGFTGIIADDTNKIIGSSDSTSDLLITKAFVSNGYDLNSLRFDLNDSVLKTIVAINEDRSLVLDLTETELNFDSLSDGDWFQVMVRSIAYIYSGLLPALIAKYELQEPSFEKQNKNFSKEIGIEVVQAIVNHNGISKDDIKFL